MIQDALVRVFLVTFSMMNTWSQRIPSSIAHIGEGEELQEQPVVIDYFINVGGSERRTGDHSIHDVVVVVLLQGLYSEVCDPKGVICRSEGDRVLQCEVPKCGRIP